LTFAEKRAAVQAAYARMVAANQAIENASSNADLDRLSLDFDQAKDAHARLRANLERSQALEEAKLDLPVSPVEDRSPAGSLRITETELTYERPRVRGATNIFRDMALAQFEQDSAARERIERHGRQMVDSTNPRVGERALNITDGTGGEFVPPIYLQDQWIGLPRARRPIADALGAMPLPPGTDTINIPKVATGTTVAVQTDGGAVSSTDLTDTHVTAAVQTVAGQQDVSQQLVDLSAPGIDQVIWDDISRAYDTKIEVLVITGAVTNAKGINQVAGTTTRTYTDASPTVPELYSKAAGAIADVHTNVFESPNLIAMHPLRWAWILASLDSQNRPLVVPAGQPGYNAMALQNRVAAEAIVGNLQALPVVASASIPTTLGAGTNQDQIYVLRTDEIKFWEGESPRLRVFGEVLSGTLQVRFQLYNYYAVMCGRLPKAISIIDGTGLVAPTF
jgi:HK97 family phage major capsid protein